MSTATLMIPIGFLIMVAILLWYNIATKGSWLIKLFLIIAVPIFGIAVWRSLDSYLGWPTPEQLPEKFILLWAEVREPNPKVGEPGKICLWTYSYKESKDGDSPGAFDYRPSVGEPRAYKLPYSRLLHQQAEQAKEMIKGGKIVVFQRKKGKGRGGGEGEGEGEEGEGTDQPGREGSGRRGGRGGDSREEQEFQFYELPPPRLPLKNYQQ